MLIYLAFRYVINKIQYPRTFVVCGLRPTWTGGRGDTSRGVIVRPSGLKGDRRAFFGHRVPSPRSNSKREGGSHSYRINSVILRNYLSRGGFNEFSVETNETGSTTLGATTSGTTNTPKSQTINKYCFYKNSFYVFFQS